jgi:hypothetical protein
MHYKPFTHRAYTIHYMYNCTQKIEFGIKIAYIDTQSRIESCAAEISKS